MKGFWLNLIKNSAGYNYHISMAWLKIYMLRTKPLLMAPKGIQVEEVP
jgi:hypothetical protein